jgi:hypothetical protein
VLSRVDYRGRSYRTATVSSGRSLPAHLTREGTDLLKRTDAGVRAADRKVMANLSAEQRREFKRILIALGSD